MKTLKSKIIFENEESLIKVETDGEIMGITSTLKGVSDTTVYCYPNDLEKALEFVKEVKQENK